MQQPQASREQGRMRLHKRILRSSTVREIFAWLLSQYIRLVRLTGRWEYRGQEHMDRLRATGQPFVLCFWHNRIMMSPYVWPGPEPCHVLASSNRDGQLIAAVMRWLNVDPIFGSSSRGGRESFRIMVRALRERRVVAITPDGPRGPRMRLKPGAVVAARLVGVPLLPTAWSSTRHRRINSWDRFLFALPFGRGVHLIGEPIDPREGTVDEVTERLERVLTALADEADRLAGQPPIPADAHRSTDADEFDA